MFYKLLGYLIWNGGKVYLRTRYGATYAPKPALAAVALAAVGAVVFAAVSRRDESE